MPHAAVISACKADEKQVTLGVMNALQHSMM
jgi:hypothetical protein